MGIFIKNAKILTMNDKKEILEDTCIFINENKIDFIGKESNFKNITTDLEIIDAKGKLVMPGLINTHTHIPMTLFRNYADDLDLHTWLYDNIFPREQQLDSEQIYLGTMAGIIEMFRTGTTCFSDKYYFCEDIVSAVRESGIRANLARSCSYFGDKNGVKDYISYKEAISLFENWNGKENGRIKVCMSAHSIYTCTDDFIISLVELAKKYDTRLQIHLAETKIEVEECFSKNNCTPIKHCENIGVFEVPTLLGHCVYLSKDDFDIIDKYDNITIVHNPASNLKLASGIANVPEMLRRGINVSLGTDSASSNNKLDMFAEMRLASLIHKGNLCNPIVMKAYDVLKMATVNGAKAIGIEDIGSIKVGMKADIIILDTTRINYLPDYNIVSSLVYSSNGLDIETVIIDGNIVMKDRELETIDEEKIISQIRKIK